MIALLLSHAEPIVAVEGFCWVTAFFTAIDFFAIIGFLVVIFLLGFFAVGMDEKRKIKVFILV